MAIIETICVETIAILVCNQISSHLKMKLPTNYSLTKHMYIHLNVSKKMTNVELFLSQSNT